MTSASVDPVLELSSVCKMYGQLAAVSDVSFAVQPGSRHAVIGPNGAGKSTLFNLVGGASHISSGSVLLSGIDITGWSQQRRMRAGMAKTFQHASLFPTLTVGENVSIAVHSRQRTSGSIRAMRSFTEVRDDVMEMLDQVSLSTSFHSRVDELSHGERRQLELAMALSLKPRLVMLDEPVAGMSPSETAGFASLIEALSSDVTVLLVEHDMDLVLRLADRITVLDAGKVIADGNPAEVQASSAVQAAYLGTSMGNPSQLGVNHHV